MKAGLDALLRAAVDAGDVPGVAAALTTCECTMFEADAPTGRSAGSLAWAGLPNTFFWIDPAKDIAGVVMMQVLPFLDAKALGLFTAFETAAYASSARHGDFRHA